nr:hypothetical protein [uncultured Undibacterium sp.]
MHLEQLNLAYLIDEDRILLRIGFSTEDTDQTKQEIQIFFTRRLLQKLWPTLMEAISAHMRLNRPEAAFASDELVNIEHQNALDKIKQSGNFDQAYSEENRKALNGERPFLLETIKFHLKANAALWIQFFPTQGGTVDLRLETSLLHGFCKLLIDAEKASGWNLELSLPKPEEMSVPAHLLN